MVLEQGQAPLPARAGTDAGEGQRTACSTQMSCSATPPAAVTPVHGFAASYSGYMVLDPKP